MEKHTVDEGEVDCHGDENGLLHEHENGACKVLGCQLCNVDLFLVMLGVDGPVTGFVANAAGPALQQHGSVGLGDDDEGEDAEEGAHDEGDPGGPPPS